MEPDNAVIRFESSEGEEVELEICDTFSPEEKERLAKRYVGRFRLNGAAYEVEGGFTACQTAAWSLVEKLIREKTASRFYKEKAFPRQVSIYHTPTGPAGNKEEAMELCIALV